MPGGRPLEIAAGGDDAGVLAAHLGDARPRVRTAGHRAVEAHADLVGAGEGDASEVGVVDERLADDAAGPREVVEDAGREAGVADAVGEQAAGPGGVGRALEDDGVAGHEGRGDGPPGEGEREVEGHDHRPDAVRLEDAAVVRAVAGQRIVGQRQVVAVVALELGRVAAEEVRRLLRLAQGLHAVLADLHRERGADPVDPLLEEGRDAPDQPDALGRAASRASREGAPSRRPPRGRRRRHRPAGSGRADAPVHGAVLRRTSARPATSRPSMCIAWVAPRPARSSARAASKRACISSGRIEHRRVGELEGHGHSSSASRRSISARASPRSAPRSRAAARG